MAKLRNKEADDFQYGNEQDVEKVLMLCAEHPTWPRMTDKDVIERMVIAAGIKARKFAKPKEDPDEVDTGPKDDRLIKGVFYCIYIPLAKLEPQYLNQNKISKEFETEEYFYNNGSIGGEVNQVLDILKKRTPKKKNAEEPETWDLVPVGDRPMNTKLRQKERQDAINKGQFQTANNVPFGQQTSREPIMPKNYQQGKGQQQQRGGGQGQQQQGYQQQGYQQQQQGSNYNNQQQQGYQQQHY